MEHNKFRLSIDIMEEASFNNELLKNTLEKVKGTPTWNTKNDKDDKDAFPIIKRRNNLNNELSTQLSFLLLFFLLLFSFIIIYIQNYFYAVQLNEHLKSFKIINNPRIY
jgi:hypothetical protein